MKRTRLAVFCSGAGSNFKVLFQKAKEKKLPFEFIVCVSNNSQCGAMQFAREQGIHTIHLSSKTHPDPKEFNRALISKLSELQIDLILLAGYMKKITPELVKEFPKRILNIHPSLLPKFGGEGLYGLKVHEAVISAGEKESGATVHFVDNDYDTGEIILQEKVNVELTDTPESLAERVLKVEHRIYIQALEKVTLHQ
ncbi:MAG: phosphoribosylglycinamide formyltransferase [Chloroherpetonaceae bacterium]|nr:phosphoribosylglycinamide formyltransferase [Chloroherpetonaceae bacterium]